VLLIPLMFGTVGSGPFIKKNQSLKQSFAALFQFLGHDKFSRSLGLGLSQFGFFVKSNNASRLEEGP